MTSDSFDQNVDFCVQFALSEEYQKQGRHTDARDILLRLCRAYPTDAVLHWRLGYVYLEIDRFSEAHAAFDLALNIDPECKQAVGGKAQVFAAESRWKDAELWYRRRLALADSPWYHEYLAHALIKLSRFDDAEAECMLALAASPDLGGAYLKIAYARHRQGDDTGAIEALNNAIRVEPECEAVANAFRDRIKQQST